MSDHSEDARDTQIPPNSCIWCKQPTSEDATALATGEAICPQCLGDLREWNQTRFVDLLVSSSLEPAVKTAYFKEWRSVRDRLAEVFDPDPDLKALPTRTSNADDYRIPRDSNGSSTDN